MCTSAILKVLEVLTLMGYRSVCLKSDQEPAILALKEAVSASFSGRKHVEVDVLGLCRGHCALMSCCRQGNGSKHIELAHAFRFFFGAGGCIWQGGDEDIVNSVMNGFMDMKEA